MNIDFNQIMATLTDGIKQIAEKDLKDYVSAAVSDGKAILAELETDLENWTAELAVGSISKSDFTDLVLGQKDEIMLIALKQEGLAKVAIDKFKQEVFDLVTDTVFALIP